MIATIAIACAGMFGTIYFCIYSLILIKKNADLQQELDNVDIIQGMIKKESSR